MTAVIFDTWISHLFGFKVTAILEQKSSRWSSCLEIFEVLKDCAAGARPSLRGEVVDDDAISLHGYRPLLSLSIRAMASSTESHENRDPPKRRIVKATKPSQDSKNHQLLRASTVAPTQPSKDVDDKDPLTSRFTSSTIESPSVKQEFEQDKIDQRRHQRLQEANARHAKKRLETWERHRSGSSGNSKAALANPFSRFLRAFSVEPEHPEHKRKTSSTSPADLGLPVEKRFRASIDETQLYDPTVGGNESDDDNSGDKQPMIPSTLLWSACAVAAAAVLFTLVRKRG